MKEPSKKPPSGMDCVRALGDEVMARVDSRLLAGDAASDIAAWIQEELKELLDIRPQSLKKALERYRAADLRKKTLAKIATATQTKATHKIVARLNSMDQMEEMVKIQRGRVDKLLLREAELPKGIVLKDTSNEIRLLKDMLIDLGRLQLETGVLARAPKTVKGQTTNADGSVQTFEWTEEQESLFKDLEKLSLATQ